MCPAERHILIDDLDANRHADWIVQVGEKRSAIAMSTPAAGFVLNSRAASHPALSTPFNPFKNEKWRTGTNGLQALLLAKKFEALMQPLVQIDPNIQYALASVSNDGELLTRIRGNLKAYVFPAGGAYVPISDSRTYALRDLENQMVLVAPNWLEQRFSSFTFNAILDSLTDLHKEGLPLSAIFKQFMKLMLKHTQLTEDLGIALLSTRQPKPVELLDRRERESYAIHISDDPKDNERSECRSVLFARGTGGMVIRGIEPKSKESETAKSIGEAFEIQDLVNFSSKEVENFFTKGLIDAADVPGAASFIAAMFSNEEQLVVCSRGTCDLWVVDIDGTSEQVNKYSQPEAEATIYQVPLRETDKFVVLATGGLRDLYKNFPQRFQEILYTQVQYYRENRYATLEVFMRGLLKNIYADARELRKSESDPDWQTLPSDLGLVILARP